MKATQIEVMEQLAHYYANEGVIFNKLTREEVIEAFKEYENAEELKSEAQFNNFEFDLHLENFNRDELPKILKEYKLPTKK